MEGILSVDVEDWFHILDLPSTPDVALWKTLPSRVESNFLTLLDLFAAQGVHATCFFLGWVAERFPALVLEAVTRGHEIASHGYGHQLVYGMSRSAFLEDIRKAKSLIEEAAGRSVSGYRCPGFSVTSETPWFFDTVAEGRIPSSSVFPAARSHGGLEGGGRAPYVIPTASGPLQEFPITVVPVWGRPLCFFGGGYLRLFPYVIIKAMGKRVVQEQRPIIFYVHPREIDPAQPRLSMGPSRRFKSYVGLRTTKEKLRSITKDFSLTTFEGFISSQREQPSRA